MTDTASRNRQIKRILGARFGNAAVRVRGSRGTGYGWVSVYIAYQPLDWDERSALQAECKTLLRNAGVDLGRTYTDDTCQHITDQCHIHFEPCRYRLTQTLSDGSRVGLPDHQDQWVPVNP